MPVRHNLEASLLSQLAERIGGHRVSEVVVHAPFYDPSCEALDRLLDQLAPSSVRILVQEHETSADAHALARVLSSYPGRAAVHAASAPEAGTYLHAKFILARTGEEDIVLSGSANISLSALCSTAASGNVEVCNLLSGPPGTFDYLLDGLTIGPPADDPAVLPVAVALLLRGSHGEWAATTPTWPYHVNALRSRLGRSADHEVLRGAGGACPPTRRTSWTCWKNSSAPWSPPPSPCSPPHRCRCKPATGPLVQPVPAPRRTRQRDV